MEMIEKDPAYIKNIENPSEELQLAAVNKDGINIKFIRKPSLKVKWEALKNNVWAIEYIENPSEEMVLYAVEKAWNTLKFIKRPSEAVLEKAVSIKGWAIQYIKEPSNKVQKIAVKTDWDSIKYIDNPEENVQIAAVSEYFGALKFIKQPAFAAKRKAVAESAEAINYIDDINEEDMQTFLEDNVDIIKYKASTLDVEWVKHILKIKLRDEKTDKNYIIKFINCDIPAIDKTDFIHQYGSKKAKRIFVDYKLSY